MGKGLTVKEMAEHFGVSVSTAKSWIRANLFPNSEMEETPRGPVRRIPRSDIRAFKRPDMGRPVSTEKGEAAGKRKAKKR